MHTQHHHHCHTANLCTWRSVKCQTHRCFMTLTHVVVLRTIPANPRSIRGCQKKNVFLQTHIKFFGPLWVHADLRYILMTFQDEKQLSALAGSAATMQNNLNNFCTSGKKHRSCLHCQGDGQYCAFCCCCLSFQPFYLHIVPLFPLACCHCTRQSDC